MGYRSASTINFFIILIILPSVTGLLNTGINHEFTSAELSYTNNDQVKVILWEDFESYPVGSFPSSGGWELVYNGQGTEYQIVTATAAYEGAKSLQLWGKAWWAATAQYPTTVNPSADIIGCEQAIMISERNPNPSGTPYDRACVFWNRDVGRWGKAYSHVLFDHRDLKIYVDNGENLVAIGDWQPGTWYHVRLEINIKTNTYKVWINQVYKGEYHPNSDALQPQQIKAIALSSDHPGVKVYHDNIKVYYIVNTSTIVTSPAISATSQIPPLIKTTTTTTPTTTFITTSTASSVVSGSSGFGVFPAGFVTLLAPIGIGAGFIAYMFIRRRGRGAGGEVVVDKHSPSGGSRIISSSRTKPSLSSSEVVFGLGSVRELLSHRLQGLVGGYGCLGKSFEARFGKGVVPEGFEGSWICCKLGCGGWGCAYRCEQDDRVVVVKVPRGFESIIEGGIIPTVDTYLLRKIVSEAEVVKNLRHPNILRLLGYSDRAPILVYEYADYGSLEWQIVNGWKPSLRDIVLIGIQVGDALRYIHSRGLVHGDVKPGNVFISGSVAKVGDFSSLVKLVTMTSRHSRLAYTPGFRAPEQAYADLRREAVSMGVESRIDTYQLGNLLLYLLTHEALDGEDAVKPGAVEEAVDKINHPRLREIVRKALTPNPLQRPSAEEIVKELLKIWKELEDKK